MVFLEGEPIGMVKSWVSDGFSRLPQSHFRSFGKLGSNHVDGVLPLGSRFKEKSGECSALGDCGRKICRIGSDVIDDA